MRITLSEETSKELQKIADKMGYDADLIVRMWCMVAKYDTEFL